LLANHGNDILLNQLQGTLEEILLTPIVLSQTIYLGISHPYFPLLIDLPSHCHRDESHKQEDDIWTTF
jgi:hypothetical protein